MTKIILKARNHLVYDLPPGVGRRSATRSADKVRDHLKNKADKEKQHAAFLIVEKARLIQARLPQCPWCSRKSCSVRHLATLAALIAELGGDILRHVTDPAFHDIESDDAGGIGVLAAKESP